jgi:hypothetical protein
MTIYQADIYDIPITITLGDDIASPDNVDDVRIAIGEMVRSYRKGDLRFEEGEWIFPLSEETRKMTGVFQGQVEIIKGDNVLHTAVFNIKFAPSVKPFIREGM